MTITVLQRGNKTLAINPGSWSFPTLVFGCLPALLRGHFKAFSLFVVADFVGALLWLGQNHGWDGVVIFCGLRLICASQFNFMMYNFYLRTGWRHYYAPPFSPLSANDDWE